MKNVTIAIDEETHRLARIRAAELGTSLSALVKDYLQSLVSDQDQPGVREMPVPFKAQMAAAGTPQLPRQPGALRGQITMADDFDEWPEDILASFEAWPHDDKQQ